MRACNPPTELVVRSSLRDGGRVLQQEHVVFHASGLVVRDKNYWGRSLQVLHMECYLWGYLPTWSKATGEVTSSPAPPPPFVFFFFS